MNDAQETKTRRAWRQRAENSRGHSDCAHTAIDSSDGLHQTRGQVATRANASRGNETTKKKERLRKAQPVGAALGWLSIGRSGLLVAVQWSPFDAAAIVRHVKAVGAAALGLLARAAGLGHPVGVGRRAETLHGLIV